jgi:hypothetical protein
VMGAVGPHQPAGRPKAAEDQRSFFVSPRGTVLSNKKKYGAKQVRYANGGGMNAKREEVEMRTNMKKDGRDCTS